MLKKKVLAIIPARGGSKGIVGKNLSLVGGQPLIAYSIELAKQRDIFCDVIVTSDDSQILDVSQKYSDSLILIKRPEKLATDEASLVDVVKHSLNIYLENGMDKPSAIFLLQPTSPFRGIEMIEDAIDQFFHSDYKSLISVSAPIQHPSDFIFQEADIWKSCFDNHHVKEGRQNFKEAWFINGSIYIVDTDYFFSEDKFYSLDSCEVFKMPIESSIDIDLPIDLMMANAWVEQQQ